MSGVGLLMWGKCRQLYLNNNKTIKKRSSLCAYIDKVLDYSWVAYVRSYSREAVFYILLTLKFQKCI